MEEVSNNTSFVTDIDIDKTLKDKTIGGSISPGSPTHINKAENVSLLDQ